MQIRTLSYGRLREAAQVLAEAFADEPIIVSMVAHDAPNRSKKIANYFVWSILLTGLETVDVAIDPFTEEVVGVALWEPPNHTPHTMKASFAKPGVLQGIGRSGLNALNDFERAGEGKHPHEPHWSLVDVGTSPAVRGMGVGADLIRHRLAMIDREGRLASLQATTARSAQLYERLGFEHVHALGGAATGVSMMWRKPLLRDEAQ